MKINPEKIKQTIAKEIFEECVGEIDKEIIKAKASVNFSSNSIFQCYVDGLTMAKNIIRILEKEKYSQ